MEKQDSSSAKPETPPVEVRPSAKRPRTRWRIFKFYGRIVFCSSVIIFALFVLRPALMRGREAARRSSCQCNLKQMSLVFEMYANEARGSLLPPPALDDGVLAIDLRAIWPEYLTDLNVLTCPSAQLEEATGLELHRLAAEAPETGQWRALNQAAACDYTYLGYAVTSIEDIELLAQGLAQRTPGTAFEDVIVDGRTIPRLTDNLARYSNHGQAHPGISEQDQATIPVMWDNLAADPEGFNHVPAGCNVLYLDGHVEFIKYPGAFPAQEGVYEALEALRASLP